MPEERTRASTRPSMQTWTRLRRGWTDWKHLRQPLSTRSCKRYHTSWPLYAPCSAETHICVRALKRFGCGSPTSYSPTPQCPTFTVAHTNTTLPLQRLQDQVRKVVGRRLSVPRPSRAPLPDRHFPIPTPSASRVHPRSECHPSSSPTLIDRRFRASRKSILTRMKERGHGSHPSRCPLRSTQRMRLHRLSPPSLHDPLERP